MDAPDPRSELETLLDEHGRAVLPDFTQPALDGDLPLHDVTVVGAVGAYLSGGGALSTAQQEWARDAARDLARLVPRLQDATELAHARRLHRMARLVAGDDPGGDPDRP